VIEGVYDGDLRMTARHGPSGATLATDAPADNQGRGENFSPTDLVATALGTCLLTTMGIVAGRHGVDLRGARFRTTKEMIADPHRRIARLATTIFLSSSLRAEDRALLERAAKGCPVHRSLGEGVDAPVTFVYEDEAAP
jgi:putative redox protein